MPETKSKRSKTTDSSRLGRLRQLFNKLFGPKTKQGANPEYRKSVEASVEAMSGDEDESLLYIEFIRNLPNFNMQTDFDNLLRKMATIHESGKPVKWPLEASYVDNPEDLKLWIIDSNNINNRYRKVKIGDPNCTFERFLKQFNLLNHVTDAPTSTLPTPFDKLAPQLDALISAVPKEAGYEKKSEMFAGLTHAVRQRIAVELAPTLNAHIQAMPHDTYEEKKALATWVNAEVERFGLTVKCPKTGLPAKLRGHTGNWPKIGRFAFEVYLDGKRTTPTVSDKLPELQLMDATPSQEPETPWQDTVGPKSTRGGRKLT